MADYRNYLCEKKCKAMLNVNRFIGHVQSVDQLTGMILLDYLKTTLNVCVYHECQNSLHKSVLNLTS